MQAIDRGMTFLREVKVEMQKITWPSREDLKESTTVVIISVIILSIIIFAVDKLLDEVMRGILRLVA